MLDNNLKHITFLRHGLSTANHEGIVQGQADYPLHDLGIAEAQHLARYWAKQGRTFSHVITSPLLRARQTTDIIVQKLSLPFEEDPLWVERSYGDGEGLTYDQARAHISSHHANWDSRVPVFANSETEADLLERASRCVRSLIQNNNPILLVVSHGGILGAVIRSILQIPLHEKGMPYPMIRFDNTGYSEFTFNNDDLRWQLLVHNVRPHLENNQ